MSSYEEFVQLPINAAEIRDGNPLFASATSAASCASGRARSGECGTDHVRLELREVELEHAVVVLLRARLYFGIRLEQRAVAQRRRARPPARPVASR